MPAASKNLRHQSRPSDQSLEKRAARAGDMSVVGTSGLRAYGGVIQEEFLKELSGVRGIRVYREMSRNDEIVGAILFAITMLIRQVEWNVQPAGDDPESEDAAEFLRGVLFEDMSTSWSDVITDICTMFPYGFAPLEIIWKRRVGPDGDTGATRSKFTDGMIGIRALPLRAQSSVSRWEIDPEDSSIRGLHQQPIAGSLVFIPIEKLLLFRTTSENNNPEGVSALRTAYRAWYFKKRIEDIEGVGIERDLAGLPVVRIPGEYFDGAADAETKAVFARYQKLVTQVRRDQQEGVLLPSDRDDSGNLLYDFALLNAGGSRTFDTTKIIDRKNRGIATSVLADFIFLGQSAVGSFALSSDKTALFATAVGGFVDSIADVLNRHLVPRLWALNALDPAVMPKVGHGDIERIDPGVLGAFIAALTGAGVQLFPDRELENWLRRAAGMPEGPEDGEGAQTPERPEETIEEGEDADA